jgi:hypothetical protein
MNEILHGNGLVEDAEGKVQVSWLKGPLEEAWQQKAEAFVPASPPRPDKGRLICRSRPARRLRRRT